MTTHPTRLRLAGQVRKLRARQQAQPGDVRPTEREMLVIEPHYGQESTVTEQDHSTAVQDLAATLTELLARLRVVAPVLADQLVDMVTQMARQLDPADITARWEGSGDDTVDGHRPGVRTAPGRRSRRADAGPAGRAR